ncbi:MAG TPA: (2Fe-2S)-binding protein [candidate division Zixibacteria bacterium]|nr:(2Fe-2S)-binding protein [candidate division Zixibacteria bacterium]
MAAKIITLIINGREIEVMVKPLTTLQYLLREELGYMAAKSGCKQGGCGSCTVLLDGVPVPSCLLPAEDVAGREITTLEGIRADQELHPIQQAFLDKNGTQCGFCTPGMILVSKALLDQNPQPTDQEISEALAGNYCRCTGYEPIIEAVQSVAAQMNGHKGG